MEDGVLCADPLHASDMLASGTRTWDDPLVADLLALARRNPTITEVQRELLPWALATVSAHAIGALGLVGRAAYSGPGATALVGNLSHRSRGAAFACELITAAALVYRTWPSVNGAPVLGDALDEGARLDFGVKLLDSTTARRTAEADILITYADGRRVAVDVKAAGSGTYRAIPSPTMLAVVVEALARGEITSFHFVAPGRFRPAFLRTVARERGVFAHEHVWPPAEDVTSIRLQESAAVDYRTAMRSCTRNGRIDFDSLCERLSGEAAAAYLRAITGERELVETTPARWTYLYDATTSASPSEAPSRLVATWGRVGAVLGGRDRSFMRGFPLPPTPSPVDRGHIVGRAAGGDEGLGINLIPQDRNLNRGVGPSGRRWRELERRAAADPGAGLFVRLLYNDISDVPVRLESLLIGSDGLNQLERFRNRAGAP